MLWKTLQSPLDCTEIKPVNPKGNQPWIFIGRTDAEVKLQYFSHLIGRADSLEKALTLGKIEGRRRRGRQRMRWLDHITNSVQIHFTISVRWWTTGKSGMLHSMWSQSVGHNWATEEQQSPPVDNILSELSTMALLFWVTLHSMTHSFTELCKPLCQGSDPWRGSTGHLCYSILIPVSMLNTSVITPLKPSDHECLTIDTYSFLSILYDLIMIPCHIA